MEEEEMVIIYCPTCSGNHTIGALRNIKVVTNDDLVTKSSERNGYLQSENTDSIDKSVSILCRIMRLFPDATIIYFDNEEDFTMEKVNALLQAHLVSPQCIILNSKYKIGKNGEGLPCFIDRKTGAVVEGFPTTIFRGMGGVLYPPHCLAPDIQGQKAIKNGGQYFAANDKRNIGAYYYKITKDGVEFFSPGFVDTAQEARLLDWEDHDYWGWCIIKDVDSKEEIRMILFKSK